jgi:hypothetical protein
MRLSRTVQTIKTCGPGVKDANCYREGDFPLLLRRAEQLEARLPTQTVVTPVPILNTIGGFAMFSNGTTDLAPELYGWYGAPGASMTTPTTLFLVGDHFSPLRTRVIVGNMAIPVATDASTAASTPGNSTAGAVTATAGVGTAATSGTGAASGAAASPAASTGGSSTPKYQRLLSRQVMQITIPASKTQPLLTVTDPRDGSVSTTVHVSTPYGVTHELLIPIVDAPATTPQPGFRVAGAKLTIPYAQAPANSGTSNANNQTGQPAYVALKATQPLDLTWVGVDASAITATHFQVSFVFSVPGATAGEPATTLTVPCGCAATATISTKPPPSRTTPSNGGTLSIPTTELDRIAYNLFKEPAVQQLAASGQLAANGLTTTQILVMPLDANGKPNRSVATNDQLTVQFAKVGYCEQDVVPTPGPCKMPPPTPQLPNQGAGKSAPNNAPSLPSADVLLPLPPGAAPVVPVPPM